MSNKSGTSVISTPSGGGAQSGLGEKFSPDLFTGTGNFSVPIALPAGRNGFQPELTLQYSTGNGNSAFGLGWGISVPGVMRKTAKGVPLYDDDKDVFILSGTEDLIPVDRPADDVVRYRPRTEGLFAKIDRHLNTEDDYWKVRSKDGLISWYGTPGAKENDPAAISDPSNSRKVFAWKLTRTQDTFGNVIEYIYERDAVREDRYHTWDQAYLKEIRYIDYTDQTGQSKFLVSVQFNYEERPDPFSEYKSGFEVRTVRRCKDIEVCTNLSDGSIVKTRSYNLQYADEVDAASELPINGVSILRTVEVEGFDGTETEKLPPLDFRYTRYTPGKQKFKKVEGPLPPGSLAQPQYEFADLFGNGLPDILEMAGGVVQYWRNKGDGSFDMPRSMKEAPSGFNLGDADVQMIDADGDGRVDLMVNSDKLSGYFPSRFGGAWDRKSFKKYRVAPSFNLQDPEVKLVDLTGDGITDAIRSGSGFECFFNHEKEGWHDMRRIGRKQIDDFPNVNFSDPRIKWADMTGDGMQDLVYVTSGTISYWPNLGYGKFGKRVQMFGCPKYPQGYDPKRILLGDVDGDGVSDVVYVDYNRVSVWINQSGNRFSDPVVITNTPPVAEADAIRLQDLYGNGTSGVLFSIQNTTVQRHTMFFLDLTGGIKPYLLNEMDNNMGALTRVHYEGSIKHYLRDQKKKQTRWKTSLPFPVQVVTHVEVIDRISKGKLTTSYLYHHGHWDGGEREFRGFGRVDQRDTETFERYNEDGLQENEVFNSVGFEHYTPPTETRNWFHLGPVGDEFGEWEEVYFEDEYWQGDPSVLYRSQVVTDLLIALPRRAKRDALRALRGSQLRTELYALDQRDPVINEYVPGAGGRPYTVTESLFGVRQEFAPDASEPSTALLATNRAGSGYIFFTFSEGSRTTQWERGHDPMTQLSFSADYDTYGQPLKQIAIAVPRGRDFTEAGGASIPNHPFDGWQNEPYLATVSTTSFAQVDTENQYMVDRASKTTAYEVVNNGTMSAFALRNQILEANLPTEQSGPTYRIIGHSVNFYDGVAYTGLPIGFLGDYGALTRSETLVITDAIINEAYDTRPQCFEGTPDWGSGNGYPASFEGMLQNTDDRLGYLEKDFTSDNNYVTGYYSVSKQVKYDFQESVQNAKGLVLETRDPFDNPSRIEYDDYSLLPVKAHQVIDSGTDYKLTTEAEYDYRVLQAKKITDPNGNQSEFGFTPLGLLEKSAVMGKDGENKGDTLDNPSVRMEYDFFAWKNNQQPVWVKTIQRVNHWQDGINDDTIEAVEYTDGFGRLLQTRSLAEDVIFGDSGLPTEQGTNGNAVGVQRPASALPNVRVSGWKVYNNKGKVVEQYEPFFSRGFQYAALSSQPEGEKIRMFYDPRGQVVRTVNPDGSEQWVLYGTPFTITGVSLNAIGIPSMYETTPWESYSFDANDLAQRTHPQGSGVPSAHNWTPSSNVVDALGRTIRTTERLEGNEEVVMLYEYDIRGNVLQITDALERVVFSHVYDLANQSLLTQHIDAGDKYVVFDATGKPVEMADAKGSEILNVYDTLSRPLQVWTKDNSSESFTVRQRMVYGDDEDQGPADPEDTNHLGKPYKSYDESGLSTALEYDFKGNVLSKKKEVIKDSLILTEINAGSGSGWDIDPYRTNWTDAPWDEEVNLLEGDYQTDFAFDALNRAIEVTYPADINAVRKVATPTFNRAGALEKIEFDGTEYIKQIAYNAKGQPLLTAYGNGQMTRHLYDPQTFRLVRSRTEQYDYTLNGNLHEYDHDGNVRQDVAYQYDLVGNILKISNRVSDCGINGSLLGSDALDRIFQYDPLYRLLQATGRESDTHNQNDYLYADSPTPGTPNANNVRAYTRNYAYDKMGNITQMKQLGTNGFTRNFNYQSGQNILDDIRTGAAALIQDFTYDANGNQITAGSTRNYEWDHADRMRAYYNQTGSAEPTVYAQYVYDGSGSRVKKFVRNSGGSWESVTYIDGVFEYHKKVNGGSEEKNYTQVDGGVEIRTGAFTGDIADTIVYQLSDHLNSVALRLNATGGVIDREEFYPFGDSSLRTFSKKRYRYIGKERDAESGLYYYGARYYAAWTCRFISIDPLASKYPFYTPYQYAGNDPINFIDLDGKEQAPPDSTSNGAPPTPPVQNGSPEPTRTGLFINNDTGEVIHGTFTESQAREKGVSNLVGMDSMIAQSDHRRNLAADGISVAPDMTFNDAANFQTEMEEHILSNRALQRSSNDRLFQNLRDLVELTSEGEMETNNLAMVEHLRTGAGADYENEILTRNVQEHPSYRRFLNRDILGQMNERLSENGGVDAILGMEIEGGPRFNETNMETWDLYKGLTVAINDVWAYEVTLVSFKETRTGYDIVFDVTLYDHFGLDVTDIEEYGYYHDGFGSWFILQHDRGFEPFVTVVNSRYSVSFKK